MLFCFCFEWRSDFVMMMNTRLNWNFVARISSLRPLHMYARLSVKLLVNIYVVNEALGFFIVIRQLFLSYNFTYFCIHHKWLINRMDLKTYARTSSFSASWWLHAWRMFWNRFPQGWVVPRAAGRFTVFIITFREEI